MNRRRVVLRSLRMGSTTRSDLARETGLSQPTTGKIVDDLLADGVLTSTVADPTVGTRPGRPGLAVKLDDVRPRFLAVQVGPVHTRLAALPVLPFSMGRPGDGDAWGVVVRTPTSMDRWTADVAAAAGPLLAKASASGSPLSAALASVPGVLDEATGVTRLSPNARWMEGQAVAAALGKAVGLPAHPIQEIGCLALGHRLADPSAGDFLLVDFGIGVGSAAIIRGELLRGGLPFAGELGHTPVPGHGDACGCGGVGCLETLVGRHRLLHDDDRDEDEDAPTVGSDGVTAALSAAGLGIAAALNVLGLDHVVVTGFVGDLPPAAFDVLRRSVVTSALAARFGTVRVEPARRHRLAGLAAVGIDRVIAPAGAN